MNRYFFSLPEALVISADGRDSQRYLNNRLSNNIKTMPAAPSLLFAAALSVQGKTEALFNVFKKENDSYLLVSESNQPENLLKALSRYKVADRVNFNITDMFVIHVCGTDKEELAETIKAPLYAYQINRTGIPGFDLLLGKQSPDIIQSLSKMGLSQISNKKAEVLRFRAGIVKFPSEINDNYMLQEANLSGSYSTSKGCYVGQEVTQKIDSFARLPYRLVCLKGTSDCLQNISEPQLLFSEPDCRNKAGEIISHCHDTENQIVICFARIKNQPYEKDKLYTYNLELEISEIFDYTTEDKKCFYIE